MRLLSGRVRANMFVVCIIGVLFFSGFSSLTCNTQGGTSIFSKSPKSALNSPIFILGDAGWEQLRLAGNCTGSGSFLDPYGIENLVIEGGGVTGGIYIVNSTAYFRIENCTIDNIDPTYLGGIVLNNVTNAVLRNNTITGCPSGLLLTNCTRCIIDNNTFQGNDYGISFLNNVTLCVVQNNHASANNVGIELQGFCTDNLVEKNDISLNLIDGLILLMNCSRNNITKNLILENSFKGLYLSQGVINSSVVNNTVTGNGKSGIWVNYWSIDNTIIRNNASGNNEDGIRLENGANNNSLLINDVQDNLRHGVALESGACNNTLYHNYIVTNGDYGANLSVHCDGNVIYGNNFTANVVCNAGDDGQWNRWDNGSIGNFWSDYAGADSNDDGIGDIPQSVPGTDGVVDNYPLWEDEDLLPPTITIFEPIAGDIFALTPPRLNVSIFDLHFDQAWYTIGINPTRFFIMRIFDGLIDSAAWVWQNDGSVTIQIWANDTYAHLDTASVVIYKDTIAPVVKIHEPKNWAFLGSTAPSYNVTITELNLDTTCLVLILSNGTMWNYTLPGFTGTIPQEIWNQVPIGTHRVRVYTNDTAGNMGFDEVTIIKTTGQIPGYPLYFIFGAVFVSIVCLIYSKRFRGKLMF